jgi:aldose 1-epimerase
VGGTPFDFRSFKPIGRDIRDAGAPQGDQLVLAHGYDHNWVINGSGYRLASVAEDPDNGIVLSTFSDQPGLQVYTGNFLDGSARSAAGHLLRQGDGLALEPQLFPDSPNRPEFPPPWLAPGDTYRSFVEWRFAEDGG